MAEQKHGNQKNWKFIFRISKQENRQREHYEWLIPFETSKFSFLQQGHIP